MEDLLGTVFINFKRLILEGKLCGKFESTNSRNTENVEHSQRYYQTIWKLVKRYQVKYLKDDEVNAKKSQPPLIVTFQDNDEVDTNFYGSRNLNVSVENIF